MTPDGSSGLPILPILPIVDDNRAVLLPRRSSYALRVSVLDACNLRCGYCAPGTVGAPLARARWLSAAAHARLAPHFLALGVRKVRFTGGEPLLRDNLVDVVAAWRRALPTAELAMTTNATRLIERGAALRAAGLDRVTVHLDTLREDRYERLMGKGSVRAISDAVAFAQRTFEQVKLNVVVQRGENDDELADFLAWSRATGVQVRFIEIMQTGSAADVAQARFVPGRAIVAALGARSVPRAHESDPAALYEKDGAVFGVIASDTEPFCGACDRLRLTANGRLRRCLYESGGVDVGAAVASGIDDDALRALLVRAIDEKRSFHPLTQATRTPFSMADVGG